MVLKLVREILKLVLGELRVKHLVKRGIFV
jgi:hypothetical protein